MSSEHSLPDPRLIEEYWKTAFGMAFPNVPNDMTARLDELGTFQTCRCWKHPPSPVQTSASPPSVPTSPQHRNVSVKYSAGRAMSGVVPAPGTSFTRAPNSLLTVTTPNVGAITGPASPSSEIVVGSPCPRCSRIHPRAVRAEACLNKWQDIRPFACGGACGLLGCSKEFFSKETLAKHTLPEDRKYETCDIWSV
ncbi:hypothetical protein PIIN_08361 [Serendipita indica DSM 11827]|uniref:Uncharacterized protein n=1 Tax=Serendipita indica (strain DSM 11827) TaxID=1109443 RepID=G4TSW6_SERID|nr:hypothetical protein PIIN_08361 [Serendipita indica DSM 11827]